MASSARTVTSQSSPSSSGRVVVSQAVKWVVAMVDSCRQVAGGSEGCGGGVDAGAEAGGEVQDDSDGQACGGVVGGGEAAVVGPAGGLGDAGGLVFVGGVRDDDAGGAED